MIQIKHILFVLICLLFGACCKHPTACINFADEEVRWIPPYHKGDTIIFKNSLGDSSIKFITTVNALKPGTPYCSSGELLGIIHNDEGCTNEIAWECSSSQNRTLAVNIYNNSVKDTLIKKRDGIFVCDIQKKYSEANTKTINGVTYDRVIQSRTIYFDIVYLVQNVGYVAIHDYVLNEWFYKQ